MEITTQEHKHSAVITVKGRLDSLTVPQVNEAIQTAMDHGKYNLIFDFSELSFLSSAGVRALLKAQKNTKYRNRGEVVLVGLRPLIRESLSLVGLDEIFKFYDDITTAVGSVSSLPGSSTTDPPPPWEMDPPKRK